MNEKNKSKLFGFFDTIVNTAGLNVLFLLCCLPVVTSGTALTALYAGLRASAKKEACFRAFFTSFRKSLPRSVLAWLILLPVNGFSLFNLISNCYYLEQGSVFSLIVSALFAVIFLGFTTMVFLFYSRFEATLLQLLQYSARLYFAHLPRVLLITVLTWLPMVVLVLFPSVFFLMGVVWLFFYFAVVSTAAIWLMNRPFIRFAGEVLGMDVTNYTHPES